MTDDELERKIADLLKEHVGIGYTLEPGGVVNPATLFLLTDGAAHVVLHAVRSSIDYHQLCGAGWDIVHEAIDAYDCWMMDDDYDASRVLRDIIERMRFRRSLYMPHETDNTEVEG